MFAWGKRHLFFRLLVNVSGSSIPLRYVKGASVLVGVRDRLDHDYNKHFADLTVLCRALGAGDSAEDIAQEALLHGREHREQLRDDAKLEAWLEFRRSQLKEGEVDDPFLFNRIRRGSHITRERVTKHAIYYIARQRGAEVGVKIMPHDFRRSFITRVIEEHDLSIAQKLAHHSNIQTTANYDVRDDNERRRAVDRFDL